VAQETAEDDFVVDDDTGDARGPARPPRPRIVAAVVALTLTALAVGGVVTVRALELIPLPPPPVMDPDSTLLDPGGVGDVRLGMSRRDLMERRIDGFDPNGQVDSEHGCWWSEVEGGSDGYSAWAWERDGEVVAVGMGIVLPFVWPDDGRSDGAPRTWAGLAFGAPLDPLPGQIHRWVEDDDAPVPVLRREHDGVTTTLADTTGDGRLDYATVATTSGESCVRDLDEFLFRAPDAGLVETLTVSGDRFAGLELGMSRDRAREVPGWQESGSGVLGGGSGPVVSGNGCIHLWRDDGGSAYVVDDEVVGFGALAVAGGPAAGMTLDRAERFLDPATREEVLGWEQDVSADPRGLWGEVTGTDALGRSMTMWVMRDHATVDGIDVPVTAPGLAGPATVMSVLVGRSC
jgi:hypothetical protein